VYINFYVGQDRTKVHAKQLVDWNSQEVIWGITFILTLGLEIAMDARHISKGSENHV
jgi:hypothetical protein